MPGRLVATILTAAAIAALPGAADAATLSMQGNVLIYRGDGAEANSPALHARPGYRQADDRGPGASAIAPAMTGVFDYIVICTVPVGGVRSSSARAATTVVADDLGTFPIAVSLGEGIDTYAGPSSGTTPRASR